jgi:NAD(P)H dehydrogenase (quinone)
MSQKLLVTGASGHLGQLVLLHLIATLKVDPADIVAATRRPDSLSAFANKGVSVRYADFEDKISLRPAFEGIDRMLLISTDALDRPGRRLAQQLSAIEAAEEAGIRHVIYTSMPNADKASVIVAPDHAKTEAAIEASSIPGWTILRMHWYFENLYLTLPAILHNAGKWFHAAGDGKLANISRDDLALAAATVLAATTEGKQVLSLSGEEALTTAEQADLISRALDRKITAISITETSLVEGMTKAGVPEHLARIFASFDVNTADGFAGTVTGDFRTITGLGPQSFSDWLANNKAALQTLG